MSRCIIIKFSFETFGAMTFDEPYVDSSGDTPFMSIDVSFNMTSSLDTS